MTESFSEIDPLQSGSDMTGTKPLPEPIGKPSYAFAKRYGVLVDMQAQAGEGPIKILYRGKLQPNVIAELRRFLGKPIRLEKKEDEFDALLALHYERSTGGAAAMMEDVSEDLDLNLIAESLPEPEDLLESEDDAPIIRLLNAMLTQAVKEKASDIHIEPFENRLLVRYRVDGVMKEVLEPPRNLAPIIVSRIKVMAKLDIAEKRVPQDGRISLRVAGHSVDVRVSTLPSGHGERVVMRLLDKQAGRLDLAHLGMTESNLILIRGIINKPHGIFLVTGPTGSGKTTTLYAAIAQINDLSRTILTVEDPVEYYIDGIGQTQVNTKVEMTFARGLRAILRQDPDVVMVGEIRDLETSQIAVQASLTGHMVFSTLHTNTAVGAVTRLRDMGVEPFLLSSTLLGVLAQRLVRTLCQECKEPYHPSESERQVIGANHDDDITLYKPGACANCNYSGYKGRTGIHELALVDEKMQQLIHDGAGEHLLEKHARTMSRSIRDDGIAKTLKGITTLGEVIRVTKEG